MFKERKSSFRKNMAILVCTAFIFMVFPEVTYAATKPSYKKFQFPEESILFIFTVFSFASSNLSPLGYDLAFSYSLSRNRLRLPKQAEIVQGDQDDQGAQDGQEQNGSFNSHGNSTSKKKPNGKNDD